MHDAAQSDALMIDVTVCVVSYNVRDFLDKCLASLFETVQDVYFEVIVSDNASSDDSVDLVKSKYPQAILIENHDNLGYAAANNLAMRRGRGRYFFVINNDTEIFSHSLDSMVHCMDEYPKLAILGPRMEYADGGLQRSCCYFPTLGSVLAGMAWLGRFFPERRGFGQHRLPREIYQAPCEVDWVSGAAMMVRREFTQQVGMMDEYYKFYLEETDWCQAARRTGWHVMFAPVGPVRHYGGEASKRFPTFALANAVRSQLYYFRKNHGYFSGLAVAVLLFGWLTLQVLVMAPAGLFHAGLRNRTGVALRMIGHTLAAPFRGR